MAAGGPGMGPICVNEKLKPYLPGHVALEEATAAAHASSNGHGTHETKVHAVSAAPYGSASILLISYAYIKMLGAEGLTRSTKYAILNANYMKRGWKNIIRSCTAAATAPAPTSSSSTSVLSRPAPV